LPESSQAIIRFASWAVITLVALSGGLSPLLITISHSFALNAGIIVAVAVSGEAGVISWLYNKKVCQLALTNKQPGTPIW